VVLQVSKKIDILVVILINFSFEPKLIFMFIRILLRERKFDHKLVNFNLIENINTLSHDSK